MKKKSMVVIKSFSNGISVILDPDVDFQDLLEQVGKRFSECAGFFGDALMAISFEGRRLSEMEEIQLIDKINKNCNLRISVLVGKDEDKNETYLRAIRKVDSRLPKTEIIRGSIIDDRRLDAAGNVVIIGDVGPEVSVFAGGDIIVLGSVHGMVYGGRDLKKGHFIAALELSPKALSLSNVPLEGEEGLLNFRRAGVARLVRSKIKVEAAEPFFWKDILSNA